MLAADSVKVLELLLHRACGHEEEDCRRAGLLPLDVGLQERLFEGGAGGGGLEHQHDLERVLHVARGTPVRRPSSDFLQSGEAGVFRLAACVSHAFAERRNPAQALVDQLHALKPHLHACHV